MNLKAVKVFYIKEDCLLNLRLLLDLSLNTSGSTFCIILTKKDCLLLELLDCEDVYEWSSTNETLSAICLSF